METDCLLNVDGLIGVRQLGSDVIHGSGIMTRWPYRDREGKKLGSSIFQELFP